MLNLPESHPWANRGKEAMAGNETINRLTLALLHYHFGSMKKKNGQKNKKDTNQGSAGICSNKKIASILFKSYKVF